MRKVFILIAAIFSCAILAAQDRDAALGIVARMSLEEKAACAVGILRADFPPTNAGICARTAPFAQYGIPTLALADGTAGVRLSRRASQRATAFPDNMALASSWDTELAWMVGDAVGKEARGYNVNVMLCPGMNIIRNPLTGRNFEYLSEDPVITGKMAAAYVRGVQDNGVATSIKHFTCNNQETNRSHNDVRISMRALREIYLKGFEICVKEADPWTAMSSYNSLNGTPVQESPWLLTGILRDEWGFNGLVMTDWTTRKHDTAAQIHAGNDLFMPGDKYQIEDIVSAVRSGIISEADLDRACLKVIELGEKCNFPASMQDPDLAPGAAVSLQAACESAVLMENRGMLPVSGGQAALFGVRSYNLVVTGSGAGYVACPHVVQINDAFRKAGAQIDPELEDLYTKYVAFASTDIALNEKVKVHIGLPLLPELEISRVLIEKAAERDDYAVVTLGRTAEEGKDRPLKDDYYLSETEMTLLRDVCEVFHAKGKKVAVVLNISGVMDTESWKELPDAILNIWLPGQEGGDAVYALLSGLKNPCGKLAVTFPKSYYDCPSALDFPYDVPSEGRNYDYTDYAEDVYVGYRYYCTRGVEVSYPFGYGLSYTDFSISGARVRSDKTGIRVTFNVTNTGKVAGRQAVGLYVSAPSGGQDKPSLELKAFSKTAGLEPRQSETMTLTVPASYLASFNEKNGRWETAVGKYTLYLGADVTGLEQVAQINRKWR